MPPGTRPSSSRHSRGGMRSTAGATLHHAIRQSPPSSQHAPHGLLHPAPGHQAVASWTHVCQWQLWPEFCQLYSQHRSEHAADLRCDMPVPSPPSLICFHCAAQALHQNPAWTYTGWPLSRLHRIRPGLVTCTSRCSEDRSERPNSCSFRLTGLQGRLCILA